MKWGWFAFIILLVSLVIVLSSAFAEEDAGASSSTFMMPSSLKVIEDSAFENTAPREVFLPDSMEYIGDRVFSGIPRLKTVYIPASVGYIGENAFAGQNGLVIVGIPGSYAQDWARQHGIRFVVMDVWITDAAEQVWRRRDTYCVKAFAILLAAAILKIRWLFEASWIPALTNPKEKPEMYPIEYDFP